MGNGVPSVVQRTFIAPALSRIAPASAQERAAVIAAGPCHGIYDKPVDRASAFEKLQQRAEAAAATEAQDHRQSRQRSLEKPAPRRSGRQRQGLMETFAKSVPRSLGSRAGRSLARGVLGSLFKGR